MKHLLAPSTFPLALFIATSLGCGGEELGIPRHDGLTADLQAVVDDVVARGATPGAGVYVAPPHGPGSSAFGGLADLDDLRPVAADEHFRAGSILKTFVATAVLQAVEAGKLGLDDAITRHLPPEISARIEGAGAIDVRMLLGHRSGIGEWDTPDVDLQIAADPAHIWTLGEMLELAAAHGPQFSPGAQYGYCNTNYELLGEILTRISGRSWRDVVRDGVIARAGLRDTTLPEPGDHRCAAPCAHGYMDIEGTLEDFSGVDPSMAGAAGGHALITTARDLTRFFTALDRGTLFRKRSTRDLMFDFAPAPEPETRTVGYGLGVAKLQAGDLTAYGHLGGTAGYQAFMLYVPATKRYVSGFVNQMGGLVELIEPVLARVSQP